MTCCLPGTSRVTMSKFGGIGDDFSIVMQGVGDESQMKIFVDLFRTKIIVNSQ